MGPALAAVTREIDLSTRDCRTRPRTWATREEIWAAVELDSQDRTVRFYPNLARKVDALYSALRKRLAIGGDGTTSVRQLARDLYPDVGDDVQAYVNKSQGIRERLRLLERQGLIAKSELRSENGAGKSLGLRIDLLAVPDRVSRRARSRGCSSAG